jgi:xylulokinase
MTSELVICVDMGTTRIKGGALNADGATVSLASVPVPPLDDWRGFVAFDAAAYLGLVLDVLREVAGAVQDPHRVRAIALTSQRATIVPVRADGTPVGPGLSWQDTSGAPDLDTMLSDLGADRFTDITCLPPSALWSVAKILRLRKHAPEVYKSSACLPLLHDFVLHALGVEGFVTDPSNASVTGLLDLRHRSWSGEILAAAGLHASMLPVIRSPGSVCGVLGADASLTTGLPEGTPLVVGGGDQQCAALGIGAFEPGEAALCLGTAAVLSCPVEAPMPESAGKFFCTAHATEQGCMLEGIHNAFAASLNWAGGSMGVRTSRARTIALGKSPVGANGVRFLPFLSGIGSPDYDSGAAGTFLGLRPTHSSSDMIRSVYEGVLLETRRLIAAAGELSAVRRLLIGGALSRGVVGQLLADVLGFDIEVTSTAEISLTGAAALAWTGSGRFSCVSEAARHLAGRRYRRLKPRDPHMYDEIYGRYVSDVRGVRTLYSGGGK